MPLTQSVDNRYNNIKLTRKDLRRIIRHLDTDNLFKSMLSNKLYSLALIFDIPFEQLYDKMELLRMGRSEFQCFVSYLNQWKQKEASQATLFNFLTILQVCDLNDTKERIESLFDLDSRITVNDSISNDKHATTNQYLNRRFKTAISFTIILRFTCVVVVLCQTYSNEYPTLPGFAPFEKCIQANYTDLWYITAFNYEMFTEEMESSSNYSVIDLTIDLLDYINWPNYGTLLKPNQLFNIRLQGKFCVETVVMLLQETYCVTNMYLDMSQARSCPHLSPLLNMSNINMPKLKNLTIIGGTIDSNIYLLSTISRSFNIENLSVFKLLLEEIDNHNVGYIKNILQLFPKLVYLEIGTVFNTNQTLYSVQHPLKRVKHVVWNGYDSVYNFQNQTGSTKLDTYFCDAFPNVKVSENKIGNIQFTERHKLLMCKKLLSLEFRLIVNLNDMFDLGISDKLPNLRKLRVCLEFQDSICPTEEQLNILQLTKIENAFNSGINKTFIISSNCALDSNGNIWIRN